MPRVTGSSSGSEICTIEITVLSISGTYLGIPFGPLYLTLQQFSPGIRFRDEFWKRLNPNLEGSYLPEYSESEAAFWTQCTSGFYLRPLQFLASDTSPNAEYSECTKTY